MTTILVSGASGIVGYGILRSLRQWNPDIRLIGTSIYTDSVAPAFCDVFVLAPRTDDGGYVDWLLQVLLKHNVEVLMPGIEDDMYMWTDHRARIEAIGARPVLNRSELVQLCRDKWEFAEALRRAGAACAISSSLEADYDLLAERFGTPFIVKPRRGFGSKGVVRIATRDQFAAVDADMGSRLMAQEYIGNDAEEYTVAAFCDGEGSYGCSIALRRALGTSGFTEKAEVVASGPFEQAIAELCSLFRPIGPTNFQFRAVPDGSKLLEINPRISSSTSIRAAFGYNESGMAYDYFAQGLFPKQPEITGGRAVRYTDEVIFRDDSIHL